MRLTKGNPMPLKEGEIYRCADQQCGCEIRVAKGAEPGKDGALNPRGYCGKEMQRS